MKSKITFLLLVFAPLLLAAQEGSVQGVILDQDSGDPLPYSSVLNKRTSAGTVTDLDGAFKVDARIGDTLEFSYLGYTSQRLTVTDFNPLSVRLTESSSQLEEVVVIGYSTATKKELTGAVSVVKAEEIESLNPNRLEQALQGQSAGVQISSQSGSPGGGFNIRIRGISSNGNNNPLILVDGVRYEDLSALDPSSIESINVLKDASASIYGVQAANGVILITTKTGRQEMKPTVSIHSYYGSQETARKIPVLNATEYALLINEAYVNGGSAPPFTDISGLGAGTDWQDEVFQSAPLSSTTLNVRGGGSRSTYAIGGSFFDQKGIVGGDKAGFQRYTGNLNYGVNILDNLKFNTIVAYANQNRKTLNENAIGSVLFNALNMPPSFATRTAEGAFTLAEGLGAEVINPLAQMANTYNNVDVNRFTGKVGLTFEPIKGLSFESSVPYNFSQVRAKTFGPEAYYGAGKVFNATESSISESFENYSSWGWDNVINYERFFNDVHKFNFTLGSSLYEERYKGIYGSGFGIPNNSFEFAALFQADEIRDNGASSGEGIFRLSSYFGRIQYSYDYKYLVSVILRRDGTTRFGPNNRFGYFPSVSLGWVLSEEDFMEGAEFIDFAKLRLSYGETGNDKIGDFRYVSSLNGEAEYILNGGDLVSGKAIGAIANPDITWERNVQFNLGLDLNLFNNRLTLTTDYFYKESQDLLLAVPVSGLTGYTAPGGGLPIANAGSIRNSGIELALSYQDRISDRVDFSIGLNATKLKNETLGLNDGVAFIQGGAFGIGQLPPTRWEVGRPIGYFYGRVTDGIFQNQAEIEAHGAQPNAQPGDIRFVDLNQDGTIDQEDRTMIGNPIPEYILGLNFQVNFFNFDFSVFADAQLNRDIVRNYERNLPLTNRTAYSIDRWYGEGTSNYFPRLTIGASENTLFSDFYVEDGSYLRIKNLQLGYTFPKSWISRAGMSALRIYGSITNLYTFTNYQGYDPNISSGSPLASGIDIGYYPQARNFIGGIKVTF
ncbi:SusC/RagA family TonB-linked outer membrane protein [Flavilitoribacter nigricans]|uniref:SusC/RagA family protein n=1 Tax=Flavilitoribacter nigricans (strain ATCC 23147 / DSM 23189 / NBRC 102662 / NCIMB 1420 / SS-2) TaxID=1122177 RepID=A0A2D0NJT4_FLAN2|nr:TonB-dependent receptor [Flavilitoribacter nigricans]PHN08626.1 SusC/RagA family protein [Flavilitoribacter nigricans DSM 23189 = NBRC 102662]